MIDIHPYNGTTINYNEQLIMRIDRLLRTVINTRPRLRGYGTNIRDYLGKNNSRLIITSIQNDILTAINNDVNGLTDFKCEQVKLLADGKTFIVGKLNGKRTEFNI